MPHDEHDKRIAKEMAKRPGWTLKLAREATWESVGQDELRRIPGSYWATKDLPTGYPVTQSGETLDELLVRIDSWELDQSRKKP